MERTLEQVEALFPQVESAVAGSNFGLDAVARARAVVERAKGAIASGEVQAINDSAEALARTLTMFRGVVAKARTG